MKTAFKETQKFDQKWLWIPLVLIGLLTAYIVYKQLILGETMGNSPRSEVTLWVLAGVIFVAIALLLVMRLHTEIDADGIRLRFFPLASRTVKWSEVKRAEVVNYGFVGGWGIRFWTSYGTVYNTRGDKGLAVELKNGRKFLIGTRREGEMAEAVAEIKKVVD